MSYMANIDRSKVGVTQALRPKKPPISQLQKNCQSKPNADVILALFDRVSVPDTPCRALAKHDCPNYNTRPIILSPVTFALSE